MYHVIVNPASRSGKGLKIWQEQIEPVLKREKLSYDVHFSKEKGDVTKIVAELCRHGVKYLSLIILGGDGTMLFVAGMVHRFEGGGFMFCPKADDSDGLLDLCAVGDLPKLLVLFALPTAFHGKHYRFQGITPYRAKRFILEADAPLWVHTDGEVNCRSQKITISCLHHAVQIIGP